MKKDFYNELNSEYLARYKNARKNNCPRTARARLRDMAKLMSEYESKPYEECLAVLREKYNDNSNIDD